MTNIPIRVGIVGANPERGWGVTAHLPALKAMPDFAVAAVATTRQESADETAKKFAVPLAFADWRKLVTSPDVDLVSVCVKVASHREIVLGALAAGKHVFCEWPLGLNTSEAEEMYAAAKRAGVLHAIGLQGRGSPVINYIRDLVSGGEIGRLISTSLIASLANSGPKTLPGEAYRTAQSSGATGLTIPGGHTLDTLCHCLGEFRELSALIAVQHKTTTIVGTGETRAVDAPDHVMVGGTLENGALASVDVKAAIFRPSGVLLQINGTAGDIVVSTRPPVGRGPVGLQRADLMVTIARGKADFEELQVPDSYNKAPAGVPAGPPFFTAQIYARIAESLRSGKAMSPDFGDAVFRHRMLDAVQAASDTGIRQTVGR